MVAWTGEPVITTDRLLLRTFRTDGAFLGMRGLHHQESCPDDLEVAWRLGFEHPAQN